MNKETNINKYSEFNDWRWQIRNSITTWPELSKYNGVKLNTKIDDIKLPFAVTPYFASLFEGENCPLYSQLIPQAKELVSDDYELLDPLGEEDLKSAPHLVHRYPSRVLFLATDRCASYCRFCTRKRWVGQGPTPKTHDHDLAFSYIKNNENIKEIIFSGGDPLLLSDLKIDHLLSQSFAIPHIDIVRFHSRMLSFAPMRITKELCDVLGKYSPLYYVTHFNHKKEITHAAQKAISMLQSAGVVVLNQAVLLKEVNDSEEELESLFMTLVKNKVKPYYLHQCDIVHGAKHFRVPLAKAISLMKNLRGKISGLCLPTLVIDIPGGHGKVPVTLDHVIKEDDDFIYLQGFNGGINKYPKR